MLYGWLGIFFWGGEYMAFSLAMCHTAGDHATTIKAVVTLFVAIKLLQAFD